MVTGTALTSCPACGHEDRGERDFCDACGAYLRWSDDPAEADTTVLEPVTDELPIARRVPPPPRPRPAPSAPRPDPAVQAIEAVKLTLSGGGAPGETPLLEVEPGASVALTATVR